MVKHIYHLSDLHIRAGDVKKCRYNEYSYVFNKFISFLKRADPKEDAIVVITGDIFHSKGKLEPSGVELFYNFLKSVSDVFPIYIIRGSHDYKPWEINEPDLLTSLLIPFEKNSRITYLNKSGIYNVDEDVSFGVLAIQDINQMDFPDPSTIKSKYKIALYHGHVETNDLFEGYDIAMLGDLHIQLVSCASLLPPEKLGGDGIKCLTVWKWDKSECPFGYASSMIRQNACECIEGHGFLKWDLDISKVYAYHIENVVDIASSECENAMFQFPQTLQQLSPKMEEDSSETKCIVQNTPDMWMKYVKENGGLKNAHQIIDNPQLLSMNIDIPESEIISKKIVEKNVKIKKKLDSYLESKDAAFGNRSSFRLLKMIWDWILCYGSDNQFYFNKLDGKINTISGLNGQGKTSFLEIILLAIFGSGFPSRSNRHHVNSIINITKPSDALSNVLINIVVEGIGMIRIHRAFFKQDDKKYSQSSKYTKIELWNAQANTWDALISGKASVDKWVSANIGTQEAFLMSCMISQNADADFFGMSQSEQKDLLDNALSVDTHTRYMELLKESRLGHQSVADMIASSIDLLKCQINEDHITNANRISILDAHIRGKKNISSHISTQYDIQDKEHYQKILSEVREGKSVDDLIYEIESLKRSSAASSEQIQILHDLNWYEKELSNHIHQDNVAQFVHRIVEYSEDSYQSLYQLFQKSKFDVKSDMGFDVGPYSQRCKSCKERQQNKIERENWQKYCDQWWAKKKWLESSITFIKFNKLSDLQIELAETKAYAKKQSTAKYILDNYDDLKDGKEICTLLVERERLVHEYDNYLRVKREIHAFIEVQQVIQEKLNIINNVQACLEGYITWLYTENIIPLVEKYTNEIMNLLDPTLKLKGWLDGNKGFDWSIKTGHKSESNPNIEKASGFQRFICGLSIRIALCNIGASGIKPRQLFLDEGFTSCDSINLEKVPDFLKVLLQIFDSILLVTHLDILKDYCAGSTIKITQDAETGTSQIKM